MPFPLLFAIAITVNGGTNDASPPARPATQIVTPAAAQADTPDVASVAIAPPVVTTPLTPVKPRAVPGHYTCDALDICAPDATGPDLLNPDGDQPGHTLGSTDPAYGERLERQLCEVKPWTCG